MSDGKTTFVQFTRNLAIAKSKTALSTNRNRQISLAYKSAFKAWKLQTCPESEL